MTGGALPIAFTLATIRSAASALDFAHSRNIVHRDVKPANFLITNDGHLKVADFGIAKILGSENDLTSTGMVLGTAQYMSPEQVASQEVTGRSDQFSLAVIAYELLTGQRPFQGDSLASVMHSIVTSEPPPLKQYKEDLSDDVTFVLRKALAKNPNDRFASCKEFSLALERAIFGNAAHQQTFWDDALKAPAAPPVHDGKTVALTSVGRNKTTMMTNAAPPATATSNQPAVASKHSWAVPIVTALVIVAGLGAWLMLRRDPVKEIASNSQPQPAAPATSAPPQQSAAPTIETQPKASAPLVTQESQNEAPKVVAAPAAFESTAAPAPPPTAVAAPPLTASANVSPQPTINTPPPVVTTPVQPVAAPKVAEPVVTATPPPNAAPPAGPSPIEVTRRMIADAVNRYRQAFESENLDALKAVWPGLGRAEQTSFQNFFRIARTVRLQLTPVGEPEITATGATGTYRRTMNATDERGRLPAQEQTVKITFLKSGEQMLIEAVQVVGR
jgi:serine/threonine-protein kinase